MMNNRESNGDRPAHSIDREDGKAAEKRKHDVDAQTERADDEAQTAADKTTRRQE